MAVNHVASDAFNQVSLKLFCQLTNGNNIMTKSKFMKGLLGASALTFLSAGSAFAQNDFTTAGTDVSNTFNLTYNVGTVEQPPITNDGVGGNDAPTVFVVDRLVNVTVASSGTPGTFSPNQQDAAVEFSVRNDGNDSHTYLLDFEEVTNGTGPDDFDSENSTSGDRIVYFVDANGDGILDSAEEASEVSYIPADDSTWPVLDADEMIQKISQSYQIMTQQTQLSKQRMSWLTSMVLRLLQMMDQQMARILRQTHLLCFQLM